VRLQYIEVAYAYRTAGVGSQLLEEAELIGRIYGATEIYGQAPNDETTRHWYARRGYGFRNGGEELYKTFWRPS
jgi:GNAT superfamily N-acetyltransferase